MLRSRLSKLLVAASVLIVPAVALGAPAGAAVATAAGAGAAGVAHQAISAAEPPPVVVPMTWYFFGYYRDLRACKEEGNQLMDQGFITNYSCQYRNGRYELYVQYE